MTSIDAHTLGVSRLAEILQDAGYKTVLADEKVRKAFDNPSEINNSSLIGRWIRENGIKSLGFSYRLDADDGVRNFRKLMYQLKERRLLKEYGGPLESVYFAGLPEACNWVKNKYRGIEVFYGDESPAETLIKLGIDPASASEDLVGKHPYDDMLLDFGKEVTKNGDYESLKPNKRSYKNFGTKKDMLVARIHDGRRKEMDPVIRAHAGPYHPKREKAVKQFIEWSRKLAENGFLDVLSIGTSQLTQERFGEEWKNLPNGGGVPINSSEEYELVWKESRPMLVRTYAGTKNRKKLAEMYEKTINIAWHALPFWWFSQIDGRGPNPLIDNISENLETMEYVSTTNKPVEANVPHHFAFRGSDDISYVASAYLSAKSAKKMGIKDFVLQVMQNDPKYTWGVNDIAKARTTLKLVRELEDPNFRVYLQTRAGLDYLSHNPEKAKIQLAGVTALMDDIEPNNITSPDIIHVVSYSEGLDLATPEIINESIKITRHALNSYRKLRAKGEVDDMSRNRDVTKRARYLDDAARLVIRTIENSVEEPYSAEGLYDIFAKGFLPAPQLAYRRDEFPYAVNWQTKIRNGSVDIYGENGKPIPPSERMKMILGNY
ncbi:MAG: cobalamin-binding protein [Candidatus Aenigmarchaeota archaeon]|nr:cobalamin-binding protein [Candidatus Aenigmarchaeota archaeon]